MHTFLIVPISDHAGLTSTSIGLVRTLDRMGVHVGFFKPISQSYHEKSKDLSTEYIKAISSLNPPEPISIEKTETMMASGQSENLLELITEKYQQVAKDVDVVIVEGLQASSKNQFLNSLNPRIARALNAEIIFVISAKGAPLDEAKERICKRLNSACQAIGNNQINRILGVIVNQNNKDHPEQTLDPSDSSSHCLTVKNGQLKLLGMIPFEPKLTQLRTSDLITPLNATVINAGDMKTRRVMSIHLCARNIDHVTQVFHAGALVVTPADRSDIIMSTCYAALIGIPIAGLILTGDTTPPEKILAFCKKAIESGLPVMTVATSSLQTANALSNLNPEIPIDDLERLELLVNHVARNVDTDWLQDHIETPSKRRLSPPAFRHQLSQLARSNPQRIVLPEGEEPRTVEAAAICANRNLAIPVGDTANRSIGCRLNHQHGNRICATNLQHQRTLKL